MSIRVFQLDNKKIINKLKVWAEELSRDKNILAVVLFGSLAETEAIPGSDADVFILLRKSKEKFGERILRFIPGKIGIGVDIFPYTMEEFRAALKENWGMAQEVLEKGLLLYGRDGGQNQFSFRDWFSSYLQEITPIS